MEVVGGGAVVMGLPEREAWIEVSFVYVPGPGW